MREVRSLMMFLLSSTILEDFEECFARFSYGKTLISAHSYMDIDNRYLDIDIDLYPYIYIYI